MANETSFDLNVAIERWRENLAQSPAFHSENLNELESHLHDSVATLRAHGLSDEEAFLIASRRIGSGLQLETEFGKVNRMATWADRILWMLLGFVIWTLASDVLTSMAMSLSQVESPSHREMLGITLQIIAPPLALGLATLRLWKSLSKPQRKVTIPIDRWLVNPLAFTVGLLILSFGFQVFSSLFKYHFLYPSTQEALVIGVLALKFVSEFVPAAGLIFIFARKRLRLGRSAD